MSWKKTEGTSKCYKGCNCKLESTISSTYNTQARWTMLNSCIFPVLRDFLSSHWSYLCSYTIKWKLTTHQSLYFIPFVSPTFFKTTQLHMGTWRPLFTCCAFTTDEEAISAQILKYVKGKQSKSTFLTWSPDTMINHENQQFVCAQPSILHFTKHQVFKTLKKS